MDNKNAEVASSGNVDPVSLNDFTEWVKHMLTQFFGMLTDISTPLFMIFFGLAAFVLVLGILLGSNRMRGAGGGGLIIGVIAFLIVKNADSIIGVLEGFTQSAP